MFVYFDGFTLSSNGIEVCWHINLGSNIIKWHNNVSYNN